MRLEVRVANVYHDAALDDDARRARLYAGDIFVYSPSAETVALCDLARELTSSAFEPLDPEMAQFDLPVEKYVAILADLKPRFIHHPECKRLIPRILESLGCDPEKLYFDVPRLRSSTSGGYLTTGIAYAFHPHRDTWYSAPQCQINWWLPVFDIAPDNCMTFYPRYFSNPVKNGSHTYDYYRWNKESRMNAAKHIGTDTRVQPRPEEPMELQPELRLLPPVGGMILFSGAQMHASVQNTSGRTRFSVDFRTVHRDDVRDQKGAANVDSQCTGTSLRDFLSCSDLERLPENEVAPHDCADVKRGPVSLVAPAKT